MNAIKTAKADTSTCSQKDFDASAWIAALEKDHFYPYVRANCIAIRDRQFLPDADADARHDALVAQINSGDALPKIDAVQKLLLTREKPFNARAWLKRMESKEFEFFLTGNAQGGYSVKYHVFSPQAGRMAMERETYLEYCRFNHLIADALENRLLNQLGRLPFVEWTGSKDDRRIKRYWSAKMVTPNSFELSQGKEYARRVLRIMRLLGDRYFLTRILNDMARDRSVKTEGVREGFMLAIARAATHDLLRYPADALYQICGADKPKPRAKVAAAPELKKAA